MVEWTFKASVLLALALMLTASAPWAPRGADITRSEQATLMEDLKGISYLAIGPIEFKEVLEPLLDWKEVRGMRSEFVPLETILSDPGFSGRDVQEAIRNFLVHARNVSLDGGRSDGVRWVLLVGDGEIIPPRYVFVNHSSENGAGEPQNYVPTDFYYAGLDGNWDLDLDGVFGEDRYYGGDEEADLEADVYVGRFAASNASELQLMVDRQLSYETDPPGGPWARSMLLAGSLMDVPNIVDKPGTPTDEGYNEYKDNAYKVITNITASLPDHVMPFSLLDYPKNPPGGYNRLFDTLNASSFSKYFQMGYSTMLLACHGDENGNCTDYRGDSGGIKPYGVDNEVYFDYDQARTLDNAGRVPLVYISNCGSLNFTEEDDTNLETIMLNPRGGAIGIIGATTETFRGEIAPAENLTGSYGNWWLAEEYFRILYGETAHPAEALYKQKWNYEAHIWKEMQPFTPELFRAFRIDNLAYNLLGDPEGPIWLDEPHLFNVSGVNPHIVTDQAIQPLVKDLMTDDPVVGAVVNLIHLGDPSLTSRMSTDSSGRASFIISSEDLSDFRLTVTHPGYLPISVDVDVISLVNLGLRDLAITPEGPSSGKEATFKVVVFNNGSLEMRNFIVKMTLSEISGERSVFDAVLVDMLGPGEASNISSKFKVYSGENGFSAVIKFFGDPIQIDHSDDVLTGQFTANEPVMVLPGMPDPLIMDEDIPLSSSHMGTLPLWSYIVDPDGTITADDLTINVLSGQISPSIILDTSNRPVLDIVPDQNWFGNGSFRILAADDHSSVDALLNVTVRPVPDKPQPLVFPESVVAYEDQVSNFTVEFSDPDSADLTVETPLDWVTVGLGKGVGAFNISISPGETEVGNAFINLTVRDGTGLNSTLLIPIRVEPTNDPPKLLVQKVFKATAGKALLIDLLIEDDSPGPYNVTAVWDFQTIVSNGSAISIRAPLNAERGAYYLTVNVTDIEGAWTLVVLRIEIDRKDRAILPLTMIVIAVVIIISLLIGYSVYSRLEEKRRSENLSAVSAPGPLPELTIDDFRTVKVDYLAMPPSQLEEELTDHEDGMSEPDEDDILPSVEDLDGDIDDVIVEFYKD